MEEANEFLSRVRGDGVLPLITSCSPGWVKFCEHKYPEFIPNLSTCKSPQQMFGAIAKTWYAERKGIDPKDVFVASVMPCTAKKFEVGRDHENEHGVTDVDVALTTREISRMIKRAGIMFPQLPDEHFDALLGEGTGAATIFGTTGGVMEAALRTAVESLTGEKSESVDYTEVRGTKGIKEATYHVAGLDINVAVASGLQNASTLLEAVKSGEKQYHFIEIMGCPGGCINGGGQPVQPASVRNIVDLKSARAAALYEADRNSAIRKSHENPLIIRLYEELLKEPGSHTAHELLHTHYKKRARF
jgi:NADP-reducing hydrogenase subunit HndD